MFSRRRFLQSGSIAAGIGVALPALAHSVATEKTSRPPSPRSSHAAPKPSPSLSKSAPSARNAPAN